MQDLQSASAQVEKSIDDRSNEIIGFLSEYLRHKSVNPKHEAGGEEKTCQDWLAKELESWGVFQKVDSWAVEKDRPNVASVLKAKGSGGRSLLFNGHSDTVPVSKESIPSWTVDPFGGEVKDGKVYGRGATDMKGGIAAFIWATRIINDLGIRLKGDVIDTMTIGEEAGEHAISVDSVLQRGYTADFVVNAESTNMQICPVGVGIYFFKLRVKGKPIHTSQKHKVSFPQPIGVEVPGVSAIDKTAKFIVAFQELEREWAHRKKYPGVPLGAANLTPTIIRGGELLGGLAENCEVIYNVWTNPDEPHEQSIKEVRDFVKAVSASDEWLSRNPPVIEAPAPEFPFFWPAYNLPLDHPGAKAGAEAFRAAFGRPVEWGAFTAVADLAWMNKMGLKGFIFGPGELSMGVHGIDEYVPVEHVIGCTKFYAEMILRWCGVE